MVNLNERTQSFLLWLRTAALPGTLAYIKEVSFREEQLKMCSYHMKSAANTGDTARYESYETKYRKLFNKFNEEVAKISYEQLTNKLSLEGLDTLTAQTEAVSQLWTDSRYLKYLNVMYLLVNETTGEYVYLVADHDKAPANEPYVTLDEVGKIKEQQLDPWAYINNRRSDEVCNRY